jgi:hypothetical protein
LAQYEWAFSLINESPILGHGYALAESGLPIHNLFLSSWSYVGFIGFALVLIFYVSFIWVWLRWVFLVLTKPSYWILAARFEWVAVLPILPLFRVWISGGGGHFTFGEWIALGVFVGLLMRNEAVRWSIVEDEDQAFGHRASQSSLEKC